MPILDLTNRAPLDERNKLPKPSNDGLSELFVGVDKVVIKDDGVSGDKALSEKILLIISQTDKIQTLKELLEINEKNTGFYCMCLGTYAIELYADMQIRATIGFHHGISIRYNKWNGDAGLAKSDDLLTFLAEQGFTEPLDDRKEDKKKAEAILIARRKWLDVAPKSFQKYWMQIISEPWSDKSLVPSLIDELNSEIPDRHKQIIALLQTFGITSGSWSGFPSYEGLPYDILKTFETKEIIEAYLNSDRNYKTRRGLGRFLCDYNFRKQRRKHLKFIPHEVIDDLQNCFDDIGEKSEINEILILRNEKNNS